MALDDAAAALAGRDPRRTLVWTLTDGVAYFRGGAAPALARLNGFATIGSDDSLFALCQDKFRAGAVLRALGLPVARMRAGARRRVVGQAAAFARTAGSSSRTGSDRRSASGRIRTAAILAMRLS